MRKEIISIVVPCYNEEEAIPNLISQLNPAVNELKENYEIELIFVDDGSKDRTYELLSENYGNKKNVKIARHERNYNLGAGLRTGFKVSTGNIIVPIDCDCTFPPAQIKELLNHLREDVDILNASPYHPKGRLDNVPIYRQFLSKSVILIYKVLMGKKGKDIYTYTVMIRAYRRKVIENIKFNSDDFLCNSEILVYALLKGYKVQDYPITLYTRQYGESNIKLLRVILSHFKFLLQLANFRLFNMKFPSRMKS